MSRLNNDYHVKSFIINYKKYFDTDLIKNNEKLFYSKLDSVRSEILKISNINKNTLFICNNQEIDKYVFLSCFSMLNKLVSNRYMNLMNIVDIWNHNSTHDNTRLENEEIFYSEQDIREDVLCVYINPWMLTDRRAGSIINTVVSSRTGKVNKHGSQLISWVCYSGTLDSLRNNDHLKDIYNMFSSNKYLYQVIDLSSKGLKVQNSINTGTNVNSLDDIY